MVVAQIVPLHPTSEFAVPVGTPWFSTPLGLLNSFTWWASTKIGGEIAAAPTAPLPFSRLLSARGRRAQAAQGEGHSTTFLRPLRRPLPPPRPAETMHYPTAAALVDEAAQRLGRPGVTLDKGFGIQQLPTLYVYSPEVGEECPRNVRRISACLQQGAQTQGAPPRAHRRRLLPPPNPHLGARRPGSWCPSPQAGRPPRT